jgi:hypothetical protein
MCAETSPPLAQNPLSWGATHHPAGRFSGNRASGLLLPPSPLGADPISPGRKGPFQDPATGESTPWAGRVVTKAPGCSIRPGTRRSPRAPRLSLSIQNDLQEQRPRRSCSSSKGRSSQGSECVTAAEGESSPSSMGFPAFGAALFPPGLAHARPWWFEAWISPRGSGPGRARFCPELGRFHSVAGGASAGAAHSLRRHAWVWAQRRMQPEPVSWAHWGDLASGCGRRSWMVPSRSASRKDLNSGRAAIG